LAIPTDSCRLKYNLIGSTIPKTQFSSNHRGEKGKLTSIATLVMRIAVGIKDFAYSKAFGTENFGKP